MSTPSIRSNFSRSRVAPCGQMTETWYPASVSERLSCHTRRSKGTERFSTRTRTSPGNGVVRSSVALLPVGKADEIQNLDASIGSKRRLDLRRAVSDNAHVRSGQGLFR